MATCLYNEKMTARDIIVIYEKLNDADKALIEKAFAVAEKAHVTHTRYSGEPYMNHLAAVGAKLAEMGMCAHTVAAGLLHDTIEDTDITPEYILAEFDEEVLFLVEGVTKLSSVRYYGSDRHNESLRKLFIATSQDIRVLIIKLADRLHNMQTLEFVPAEKQFRIARETLEIYVPVAHRLGMGRIRKELEDLAFPYVYPEEFERVQKILLTKAGKANELLERERKVLQKRLAEINLLNFKTSYRVKGLYSLYHKLKRKEWDISAVYDLMAMRVVIPTVEDCYRTLGIIHKLWRPLPGRVKDYIAFPKPNGYQSLHTTVATPNGIILEIQIRTERMHHESEFGVASHISYKEQSQTGQTTEGQSRFGSLLPSLFKPFSLIKKSATTNEIKEAKTSTHREKIPRWIAQIGQMHSKGKSTIAEFAEDGQTDFFSKRIFVFTPAGDVVDLPVGATPVDFAYAIHSEVGDHIFGVKVNKKQTQLDSELKNGDIIEIETRKSSQPTAKWLTFVKTSVARRKIKASLEEKGISS